jgi:filamentous hemagglutinin family protein
LNANDIADFLSNPEIRNILGPVVGGDASTIDGLIQLSGGNANLYVMNAAGFIFGNNASLKNLILRENQNFMN